MKKEVKLAKKILRILKQLNQRDYLHHFGPKKYKFYQHAFALLMKEVLRCSFRRCENILKMFDVITPTYSALCKCRKRIPIQLWNSFLKITSGINHDSVAVDSTGFARTNPSYHYIKRIDSKNPVKRYAKLSAFFDLPTRKFAALKIRVKPRHDMKSYSEKEYHQRSVIESGFGSLKRKYGGNVSGKSWRSVNCEIYCKAISHNLMLYNQRFSTEPYPYIIFL